MKLFFIYLIPIILIIAVIDLFSRYRRKKYIKNRIIHSYENSKNYTNINMEHVEDYYDTLNIKNAIDDITWNDLNLTNVYKRISNLQSFVGMNVLYKLLRTPTHCLSELSSRESILYYFHNNPTVRTKVQYLMRTMLGRDQNIYIHKYINMSPISNKKLILFRVLRYLFICSIISTIIFENFIFLITTILALALILILNIYYFYKNKSNEYLDVINLIKCAKKINNMKIDVIENRYKDLDSSLSKFKEINRKILSTAFDGTTDILGLYIKGYKILFLGELIDNEEIHCKIANYNKEYMYIYNFIGEIDALISVDFFRNSLSYYCTPNYDKDNNISFIDIYNPLIKNSISNSLEVDSQILITGSNASGKSTFLRSIGINILLGQTINTVCAKEFKSRLCTLYTSMSLNDSLMDGDSFYTAEVKAIKRMMDSLDKNEFSVFIIDEILKGTNTLERVAGGASILEFFSDKNCLCFIATHDLELTTILEDKFKNYNFDGELINDDIIFDYKIKEGISKKRNAIKLLKSFHYNNEILMNTKIRIENFKKHKIWT